LPRGFFCRADFIFAVWILFLLAGSFCFMTVRICFAKSGTYNKSRIDSICENCDVQHLKVS
jgi:hypothetical protein